MWGQWDAASSEGVGQFSERMFVKKNNDIQKINAGHGQCNHDVELTINGNEPRHIIVICPENVCWKKEKKQDTDLVDRGFPVESQMNVVNLLLSAQRSTCGAELLDDLY